MFKKKNLGVEISSDYLFKVETNTGRVWQEDENCDIKGLKDQVGYENIKIFTLKHKENKKEYSVNLATGDFTIDGLVFKPDFNVITKDINGNNINLDLSKAYRKFIFFRRKKLDFNINSEIVKTQSRPFFGYEINIYDQTFIRLVSLNPDGSFNVVLSKEKVVVTPSIHTYLFEVKTIPEDFDILKNGLGDMLGKALNEECMRYGYEVKTENPKELILFIRSTVTDEQLISFSNRMEEVYRRILGKSRVESSKLSPYEDISNYEPKH